MALAFVIVMDELNQLIKVRESHGVRELLITTHPGVGSAVVVGACQDLKDVSVAHRYQHLVQLRFQICWDRGEVVLVFMSASHSKKKVFVMNLLRKHLQGRYVQKVDSVLMGLFPV